MSFVLRELDRIRSLLIDGSHPQHSELYAAQQALSWAQEPDGFASPLKMITGTLVDSRDCPPLSNPAQS